jgi:hypothetical protein
MSNRRKPQATPSPDLAEAAERLARCPDCMADVHIRSQRGGVLEVDVRHDPTCPRLAAMERGPS